MDNKQQSLRAKNAELQKELAEKNRELDIEAALERVRAVALSMQQPADMLAVCRIICEQLQLLGINEIRNVQTAIIYASKNLYINYEYYRLHEKALITEVTDIHPVQAAFIKQMLNGPGSFFTTSFTGIELKEWLEYQKTTNVFIDTHLAEASSLNYYWHSLGPVALGMSTYAPLSEGDLEVFKRFRNVFDLSYRRYLDIEQAENQALEAKIEAALEKVRSRSMGMQKSDELKEVIQIIYEQFVRLNINIEHTGFVVDYDAGGDWHFWIADHLGSPANITMPNFDSAWNNGFNEAKQKGLDFFSINLNFDEKNRFYKDLFKQAPAMPEHARELIFSKPGLAVSTVLLKDVALYIENFSGTPYTDEENATLKRFGKVFQQAYTRFLDLQKAEEQAREAQIQLALERVRARTMAMQHSDELAETVFILFQQFKELGENPDQATIGIINEAEQMIEYWVTMHGSQSNRVYKFSIDEPDVTAKIYKAWKNQEKSLVINLQGKPLKDFSKYRESKGGAAYNKAEKQRIINVAFFSKGLINVQSTAVRSEESVRLLERFAAVFDGTYTRFLDLKQAEAQAREAQIELGLERVRARAMAMQNSNELAGLVATVLGELKKLDFALSWCLITIVDYEAWACRVWMANTQVDQLPQSFYLPFIDLPFQKAIMQAWKERKTKWVYELKGDDKKETDEYMFTKTDYRKLPEAAQASIRSLDPAFFSFSFSNFGGLQTGGPQPLSDANLEILSRFGRVFDLTYTRFNDLKQAEAQAREAQIQLALERVRAKTAAMQHQDDLLDVIVLLSDQLVQLGFDLDAACFSNGLSDTDWDLWLYYKFAAPGKQVSRSTFPWADHPVFHAVKAANENFKKGIDLSVLVLNKADKDSYLDYLIDSDVVPGADDEVVKALYGAVGYNWSAILLKETWVAVAKWNDTPFTDEQNAILRRFASAFGQTYTRYLDLQKAEKQAREAQIQLALERIRSRSMAMQKSGELAEIIQLTFDQFLFLGFCIDSAAFVTDFGERSVTNWWLATPTHKYPSKISLPVIDHPVFRGGFNAYDQGMDFFSDRLTLEEKNSFLLYFFKYNPGISEQRKQQILAAPGYARSCAISKNISLSISNYYDIPYTDQENAILCRLSVAFDQTYTRFLDLQKAEAQVYEARIEAALERVRGKAMAMHRSSDLNTAVLTVFDELEKLDVEIIRCGIGIIDKENRTGDIWTTVKLGEELLIQVSGKESFRIHPLLQGTFDAWLAHRDFSYILEGEDMAAYYKAVATTNFNLPESHSIVRKTEGLKQYYYTPTFQSGNLYGFKDVPFDEDTKKVMQRFAAVLNLTFNRFFDLQNAESRAREAVKQASVDRVRADIASMRTTADLERITPLIWNELTTLGVPFIRSGVFIVDEPMELIHTYLSTPDGKALAAFDVPFGTEGLGKDIIPAWRKKQVAMVHWSAAEFAASTKNLVDQGALGSRERLVTERPDTSLDLHLFPFLQGMLYVGNTAPLAADDMDLAQSLAEAFSTAYARYEDFNKLEAAKAQVEKTLTELKLAQTQLVQKEKMASLGELTAGIAHEIQNPLNFVNNFSEVNRELLEELKAESAKPKAERDEQLEIDLINDLIENESKINHHGKRADGIVKGMLEHSRTGAGEKVATSINTLADEFLKLSYHGLRAKDKNFNAEMTLHLDETLPKLMVVQQDIGRVLINLFNNAFYAVNQKKKIAPPGYRPEVTVTTSLENEWVLVKVKDNGNGISDAIKDKIMQPFFTTKPTGEGTGLGLSLSYDIVVKGHGGSVGVDTKEGEGSEFVVILPV